MILSFIGLVCLAAALLVFAVVAVLVVEIAAAVAFRADGGADAAAGGAPGRVVVLVPAHNEASGIVQTLGRIAAELPAGGRILVVADNCTDRTAELAAEAGAEVLERTNATLRGKGYALDFGVRHLEKGPPPDVVVIVDADCDPAAGSLAAVSALALAKGRPVQGLYLLETPKGAVQPYLKIATIAWRLKNFVRPLGLKTLGLPCQLVGTGMAFPWALISAVDLHTGHLVEDVALGLDCAVLGKPALFCPQALFTSSFPVNQEAQKTQRSRWEAGHLGIIARDVPSLIVKAVTARNWGLLALALDIAVPPLSLLVVLMGAATLAGGVLAVAGGSMVPLALSVFAVAVFAVAVLLARNLLIKDTMSLSDLLLAPAYVLSKIVLYLAIMVGRKVEWIRTKRD